MEQHIDPPEPNLPSAVGQDILSHRQNLRDVIKASMETRKTAAWTANTLTKLVHDEKSIRRDGRGMYLFLPALTLLTLVFLKYAGPTAYAPLQLYLMFTILLGTVWAGVLILPYRRRFPEIKALSPLDDTKQLGLLIRTLSAQNRALRDFGVQNLITLLPKLHAGEDSLIGKTHRAILQQQLMILPNDLRYRGRTEPLSRAAYRREMDLRLAILKALEKVGGEQELATVTQLAQSLPTGRNARTVPAELRAAAQECLPPLQMRAAGQRSETQLLRASSLATRPGSELLRPAASGPSTPPEQLLRAGEPHA